MDVFLAANDVAPSAGNPTAERAALLHMAAAIPNRHSERSEEPV